MIVDELTAVLGFKMQGEGELKRFNETLDQTEHSATASANRIRGIGVAAGAAATAAGALAVEGFKNFAGFERQMTRIGLAAGASAKDTADAGKTVQDLALGFALPVESAVSGLDTLVASGLDLETAMEFLPSVLATAQASGAAVEDIANTALKTSSALGIAANDMQGAFDEMVTGGNAGQFELRDMAAYIPTLANQFANLGYKGRDGLKTLVSVLQTIREDTGSSAQAAVQAQNIFAKMFSQETEKNFSGFGVKVREEVDAAVKAGEGAIDAYVRISRRVLEENPTARISDLFVDQEFQLGMSSLINSADSLQKFLDTLNSAEVDGAVFEQLNRVMADNQASLDRLSTTWDKFMKKLGDQVAEPMSAVLDEGIRFFENGDKIDQEMEKAGLGWWRRNVFVTPWDRGEAAKRAFAKEVPDALKGVEAQRDQQRSQSWNEFLFGDLAKGKSFKDVMAIETGATARQNVSAMTGDQPAEAISNVVNDSRNQSVKVEVGGVTVNGVAAATGAVGAAVGNAIGNSAAGAAKLPPTRTVGSGAF